MNRDETFVMLHNNQLIIIIRQDRRKKREPSKWLGCLVMHDDDHSLWWEKVDFYDEFRQLSNEKRKKYGMTTSATLIWLLLTAFFVLFFIQSTKYIYRVCRPEAFLLRGNSGK